jgi:ABC-type spermidine/putrescine transport system permease subunit I
VIVTLLVYAWVALLTTVGRNFGWLTSAQADWGFGAALAAVLVVMTAAGISLLREL